MPSEGPAGGGRALDFCLAQSGREQERDDGVSMVQSSGQHRPTILLVDDDPAILALGQELLELLGFQVLVAVDGDQALYFFHYPRHAIDLVIMDLNLPRRSGYQVLEELRRLAPQLKVIVTSGFFGQKEIDKLRTCGVARLIHKPFRSRQLQEAIHEVLAE